MQTRRYWEETCYDAKRDLADIVRCLREYERRFKDKGMDDDAKSIQGVRCNIEGLRRSLATSIDWAELVVASVWGINDD